MGLISGLAIGILVGIMLMAGWKQMMSYRSNKRVTKAGDVTLLGSLSRDDLKKICHDNVPEWISFPAFEQVRWLNRQINKLWPFVAEAASAVIKESVEPILEQYRPPGISSLKFSKLFLGNVPPKLKLKDLQVFTVVRVIFQLTEEIPCISAVVAALLSEPEPRIDYILKAVGGSLTAVPGLSDMIDDTVQNIVADMLQWPHRIVVPIGGVSVDTSELELRPQGELTVTVVKANGLKNMEMIGNSDPYVLVHVRPLFKVKTKVIDNNLNPVWNETFKLIVEDKETQAVFFEVLDKDIGHDKRLGVVKFPLIDLDPEELNVLELRLLPAFDMLKIKDKKDRGTLTIKATYHEFNKEEQLAAMEQEKKMLEEREKLKEAGVVGSTMDALDGAASLVGSGVGAGVGLVGSGLGAGVGLVETGIGAVGSGLGKAGRFVSKTVSNQLGVSLRRGSKSSTTVTQENPPVS